MGQLLIHATSSKLEILMIQINSQNDN